MMKKISEHWEKEILETTFEQFMEMFYEMRPHFRAGG
jgi:hypothetical protein